MYIIGPGVCWLVMELVTGCAGSKGLSSRVVEEGKGWSQFTQLCQEPSNHTAGISLRAWEIRKLPEEIILQERSWMKALLPWWRLIVTALSPAVLAVGASQELCLGFLGSQDLGFLGRLSKAWCTQGCGHRRCIHTYPGQSGTPQVSDVLLGRVELRSCDGGTPSCFPNKPASSSRHCFFLATLSCPFPWHWLHLTQGTSRETITWFACGVWFQCFLSLCPGIPPLASSAWGQMTPRVWCCPFLQHIWDNQQHHLRWLPWVPSAGLATRLGVSWAELGNCTNLKSVSSLREDFAGWLLHF